MTTGGGFVDDLKPSEHNVGPLTVERVFTICQLIAYRVASSYKVNDTERDTARFIANKIEEIERAWR